MPAKCGVKTDNRESIFLNEHLMTATCAIIVLTGLLTLVFCIRDRDFFAVFEVITKLVTASAMYLTFKYYKWDVAKGLMGGVLFCLMYQEAHLVLARLWGEQNFDSYLVAGVQGSIYLAAAGMTFLMTVIITVNHFFINYSTHGNPKNVILNRIAIVFKYAVYVLLLAENSRLGFAASILWRNALQYLHDGSVLLLLVLDS